MLVELALATLALASGTTASAYAASRLARARRAVRRAIATVRKSADATRAGIAGAERSVKTAAKAYSETVLEDRLRATPVEDLRKIGVKRVRWSAIQADGVRTVADLRQRSASSLHSIPGVGAATATGALVGAEKMAQRLAEEPVNVPRPDTWASEATRSFARAAWSVLQARERLAEAEDQLAQEMASLKDDWQHVRVRTRLRDWLLRRVEQRDREELEGRAARARGRVEQLRSAGLLDLAGELERAKPSEPELKSDYANRYADYAAVFENALHAIAPAPDTAEAGEALTLHGPQRGIPADIARRIEAHPLDTTGLRVTLRRYQQFGAKYLLAQERTVLGDEMGLGKTIQALAAMVHLSRTGGAQHFLVVSPASILRNWAREIEQRTDLELHLLHGSERDEAAARWVARGGIGVTSYGTLSKLGLAPRFAGLGHRIGLCIVDEAHYAKNPEAARSRAVQGVARESDRICLMSGTPLENRLEEFRHLVSIVSPEIAEGLPTEDIGFRKISKRVAPVYLRRNQPDVLRELPERIEMEEWLDLSGTDIDAYRTAVDERNYMAMRRAATIGDGVGRSAKVARLAELLDEYRAGERKVVVFSYFLDVLGTLASEFSPLGTLQGAVAPERRQEIVDHFQSEPGHALLLSQIEAGGVGINLQAASVVVLMEPQWKPSTENQAIARAHRMGQTQHVLVHRMLARECVDERMVELLRRKQELFDHNVRDSDLKNASSEATERGFAKAVIDQERVRLSLEPTREQ